MFKELTDKINYSELEKQILKFWQDNKIFEKSISSREGKPSFTFYEGPPTANGRPGIHHVMSRTLKDLVCRYKTMRGFQVNRKAGWDTHGLPVEIEVEKSLGFKHKEDIIKYGVEAFNAECKKSVWKYKSDWEELTSRMGYWVNLDEPYITFENYYIESIWWALKQFYEKDMIYKGYKIQPYCPRCETPLSSHEVSLGYEDVKDPSIYVKMKVKGEKNTYFLVWTTTPWTLISNVALAVHPDVEYVKVENQGEKLILAKPRLSVLEGEYVVVDNFIGKELVGKEYIPLFNYVPVKEKSYYVIEADFVTTEDGTGIVHIAPAYGEDDYQVGRKYLLPTIHPVNRSGEFNDEIRDYAGKFVKEADPLIINDLKFKGILYKKETITHSYPHCWRCKTPLLYYARESWYISTTKYARRMIELNKQINWVPAEVGTGRFGNWLEENKDWALSRDRFWGTPLPIWICECGEQKCVGSIEELSQGKILTNREKLENINLSQIDLHKPFVDKVVFECSKCGKRMYRTPELIDVWFDSGAMPFAQWHYPFENREIFLSHHPADFICEGIDQTRGWFYSLHAISTFLFDKPAFKNLLVNELILDKEGQKMSKSRGNTVDPFLIIENYGADTTRWYLVVTSPPWKPTLFNEEGLQEVQRKFFGTLINTYSFFALYANIDNFNYSEPDIPLNERPEIDRWIISSLNSLIVKYYQAMDEYDVTKAARMISDFTIDQLSNWYVRRNRRRFWKSELGKDKTAAYQTLYQCLITISKLLAPFAPFIAEEIFRNLNSVTKLENVESVHLAYSPEPDLSAVDEKLEERMSIAQRIVYLVRAIRTKANLKVRQPLRRIIIPIRNEEFKSTIELMRDVILDEINVKQIEYVSSDSDIVHKRLKPNFKSIGPKFGKFVQPIANIIKSLKLEDINKLEQAGELNISINGNEFKINKDDVEIVHEDIKGWLVESDNEIIVALDTELTQELIDEGYAREFVNRVQNMRRDFGFDVTDRIKIFYDCSEKLHLAIGNTRKYISTETLAESIEFKIPDCKNIKEWDINGEKCIIGIERFYHQKEN
ncbi:MAG: Isoleucyl-tRNA synthetase [Ignavibacteriae bacterium]|nr:MAG: Isoleucyl-tRNA synthetase [Ignavibacteriota bacterium]